MAFQHEYQNKDEPIALQDISWLREGGSTVADVTLAIGSQLFYLSARGNGPLDAVSNVLKIANPDIKYQFVDYEEHALETGSDSHGRRPTWSSPTTRATTTGASGWHSDIIMASVYALITRCEPGEQGQAVYPHPRLNPRRVPPDIHRNFKRGGLILWE